MKAESRADDLHHIELIERELADLGTECRRAVTLLERLRKARATGRDVSDVIGELGAVIIHLHVHTKGLDRMLDELDD